jgi:hypothetical protein
MPKGELGIRGQEGISGLDKPYASNLCNNQPLPVKSALRQMKKKCRLLLTVVIVPARRRYYLPQE